MKLAKTHLRFMIPLTVVESGSGIVRGLLTETDQTQIPAYTFVNPRRILRTPAQTPIKFGMVVKSPSGEIYIVGENGASDGPDGTIWQSFRLFEANKQATWVRRTTTVDPVTQQEREGAPTDMGSVWVATEPLDREVSDRKTRSSHEQFRFLAGAAIKAEDMVDGKRVIRADKVLGITLGVLSA